MSIRHHDATSSLGVVVLAYGPSGRHLPLVESLIEEGVPPEGILIVHNPSEPGQTAPPAAPGCELIEAERNLGYAGGMNLGIARMRERGVELLLLLTHDASLRDGALAALLDAAERQPRYGALGPGLVLTGTDTPYSFGGITRRDGTNAHLRDPAPVGPEGIASCDWVDGGTILLRREPLATVGGFDERFWGYCEEADLCLRLRRAGFAVGVVAGALADQEPGGAKRLGPWAYLQARNGTEYARRAVGRRGALRMLGRALATMAVNLARVALRSARLRPGAPAEPWAIVAGTARGTLDYLRGRWGPPPDLPGMGDLSNA